MPTVLITGANRGLGLEFARQYATADWRVIATARNPDKAAALRALGPRVNIHRLDVADLAATVAANAADWADTLRVDVMAPLALAGAFHAQVARSEQRKMIAITSRLGSMGANGDGGLYVYRSAKAALNAVWRSFALDHPDVIAALLHPGWVRTDMGGAGALLDPEQSITGLRRVIANLAKADSGRFYNYDGSAIPW